MTFVARTRDTIRASFLGAMTARFAAIGKRLVTAPRTFVYLLGDALAVELEGVEAAAAEMVLQIWPHTASPSSVARHAGVYAIPRRAAVAAHLRARVTGPVSSTVALPVGRKLVTSRGAQFTCASLAVTTGVAGVGYVELVADVPGDAGNLPAGTTLTWSNAPASFAPTAVLAPDTTRAPPDGTHLLSAGEDQESVASWAARILARIAERPGSGNRADWIEWTESVDGVGETYVYPRTRPSDLHTDVLGCVTVVALAPRPTAYTQNADGSLSDGLTSTFTRVPSPDLRARIRAWVEGTADARGDTTRGRGYELRPCTMAPGNWDALAPVEVPVGIRVAVATDPTTHPWPFDVSGGALVVLAATTDTITLPAGAVAAYRLAQTARLAVDLGNAPQRIRGQWWLLTITQVMGDVLYVTPPMPVAPAPGSLLLPDPGVWDAIRRELLTLMDSLGPGPGAGGSWRYPPESTRGPANLYLGRILEAVFRAPGVLNARVDLPAASIETLLGMLLTPNAIRVTRM